MTGVRMVLPSTPFRIRRAFHGSMAWEQILREGLDPSKASGCPHVWLALMPEDAAPFGMVIEVDVHDFADWPQDDEGGLSFQACYHGPLIESSRLKLWPAR